MLMKNESDSDHTVSIGEELQEEAEEGDVLDSGLIAVIPKEEEKELDEEEAYEDLQMSKQNGNESQNSEKSGSSCSIKSERENLGDFEYSLPNKKVFVESIKKEDWFRSVGSQESTHSLPLTNMKKMSKKALDSFPNNYANEKASVNGELMDHYMKAEQENVIKDHELKKVRRKMDGGSANAILDLIIKDEGLHGKANDECIPLKFKFDESDDDSSSQATNDPDVEGVFQEMGFPLDCEAIGSYRTPTPTAESEEKDDYNDDTKTSVFKLCQRGDHKDVYLEEQMGKRCRLCGAVLVESKFLIPKLADITPDKSENMRNERINRNFRQIRDFTRETKMRSWSSGGIVLGVSYSLFQKLVGNKNKKNMVSRKIGNLLLDIPELLVLDEGHTPRNQTSNIWNTHLKLKTKNHVILSGTPFQNNFRELFNTLRLVRPAMAIKLEKEKVFADMIQPRNKKKASDKSTSKDIAKLKKIISPFVHVHKGHILEDNLLGGLHQKDRQIIINEFNDPNSKAKVLLASTKTCSEGIHLVGASRVVLLDVDWNPTVEKQVISRAYRLGQKKVVHTYHLMVAGTTEEEKYDVQVEKGRLSEMVFSSSSEEPKNWIHLVGASRVVLLDVDWNPAVEKQAISRAYRLGQKKVVHTYHLMVAGTTEEEKYDVQVEKGRLAEMVFSSSGEEPKNKHAFELKDMILEEMVDHPKLKDIFKNIK
nr:hypothetical protein [Tanacetum cinerariifolium]